ncbi:MAG: hypothetical protein V1668_04130 [Patescibacteria group bacterium]
MVATEIVRTLTGSIGLVLAVPIATLLAIISYVIIIRRLSRKRKKRYNEPYAELF